MTRDREQHLKMMESPDDWPRWPMLPLKRTNPSKFMETGFMVAYESGRTCVFLAMIFDIPKEIKTFGDLKEHLEFIEYADFDAILDDGWVVD